MKKKAFVFLTLIMCFSFTACGKNNATADKSTEQIENNQEIDVEDATIEETTIEAEIPYDDSIIDNYFKESGVLSISFEEDDSFDYEYDYDIPKLNLTTATASQINADIENKYSDFITHFEELKSGEYDLPETPSYYQVEYQSYWNDSLLSLVITNFYPYDDYKEYLVYNYDVKTDSWLDSKDMYERAGLDVSHIMDYKICAASKESKKMIDNLIEEYNNTPKDSEELYWRLNQIDEFIYFVLDTITNKDLAQDQPMYFDNSNQLIFIAPISVPAAGGTYYAHLPLITDDNISDFSEYEEYVNNPLNENHRKLFFQLYDIQGYEYITEEKSYYLGFDSDEPTLFLYQEAKNNGEGRSFSGNITWLGLDTNGHKFGFRISESNIARSMNDEVLGGEFYIKPFVDYSEDDSNAVFKANYSWISGDDLFEVNHQPVELTLSFG